MYATFKLNKLLLSSVTVLIISAICTLMAIGIISPQKGDVKEAEIELPVIMYHGIRKDSSAQNEYVISPQEFENDLKYLKENNYTTIVVQDLLDYFEKAKPLPEKPIMLTFDDGYYNNFTYAFPLLKKYNSKIVLSPIGKYIDEYQENGDENPAYAQADWDDLRIMAQSGLVELQNHTYNLHSSKGRIGVSQKSGESDEEYTKLITDDISKLNKRMSEELDITPTAFVYPFGKKTKIAEQVVKNMGFKASFDCESKMNRISSTDDLYNIHRFIRPHNVSTKSFFESTVR